MSLITLPNEILFLITDSLAVPDLHSLILTSRVFSLVLPPVIHRLAATDPKYVLSALFHAAVRHNNPLIITILSRGRDIAVMQDHRSVMLPFHTAPAPCSATTLAFVLAQGANLVLQQGLGTCQWHALHWAAWRKDQRFIRVLLARGADINKRDTSGRTVLHDTVWRRDPATVRLLLEAGADLAVRDLYGRTAVDLADAYRYCDIVQIIVETRPEFFRATDPVVTPLLLSAAARNDHKLVRLLARCGVYLEIEDHDGRTPLHLAAKGGCVEAARILLDYGARLDQPDCRQQTPLHLASMEGDEDVVRLLAERGADVSLRDMFSRTPQDIAILRTKSDKWREYEICTMDGLMVKHAVVKYRV